MSQKSGKKGTKRSIYDELSGKLDAGDLTEKQAEKILKTLQPPKAKKGKLPTTKKGAAPEPLDIAEEVETINKKGNVARMIKEFHEHCGDHVFDLGPDHAHDLLTDKMSDDLSAQLHTLMVDSGTAWAAAAGYKYKAPHNRPQWWKDITGYKGPADNPNHKDRGVYYNAQVYPANVTNNGVWGNGGQKFDGPRQGWFEEYNITQPGNTTTLSYRVEFPHNQLSEKREWLVGDNPNTPGDRWAEYEGELVFTYTCHPVQVLLTKVAVPISQLQSPDPSLYPFIEVLAETTELENTIDINTVPNIRAIGTNFEDIVKEENEPKPIYLSAANWPDLSQANLSSYNGFRETPQLIQSAAKKVVTTTGHAFLNEQLSRSVVDALTANYQQITHVGRGGSGTTPLGENTPFAKTANDANHWRTDDTGNPPVAPEINKEASVIDAANISFPSGIPVGLADIEQGIPAGVILESYPRDAFWPNGVMDYVQNVGNMTAYQISDTAGAGTEPRSRISQVCVNQMYGKITAADGVQGGAGNDPSVPVADTALPPTWNPRPENPSEIVNYGPERQELQEFPYITAVAWKHYESTFPLTWSDAYKALEAFYSPDQASAQFELLIPRGYKDWKEILDILEPDQLPTDDQDPNTFYILNRTVLERNWAHQIVIDRTLPNIVDSVPGDMTTTRFTGALKVNNSTHNVRESFHYWNTNYDQIRMRDDDILEGTNVYAFTDKEVDPLEAAIDTVGVLSPLGTIYNYDVFTHPLGLAEPDEDGKIHSNDPDWLAPSNWRYFTEITKLPQYKKTLYINVLYTDEENFVKLFGFSPASQTVMSQEDILDVDYKLMPIEPHAANGWQKRYRHEHKKITRSITDMFAQHMSKQQTKKQIAKNTFEPEVVHALKSNKPIKHHKHTGHRIMKHKFSSGMSVKKMFELRQRNPYAFDGTPLYRAWKALLRTTHTPTQRAVNKEYMDRGMDPLFPAVYHADQRLRREQEQRERREAALDRVLEHAEHMDDIDD